MTVERLSIHEDATQADQIVDQASELLATAITVSPDPNAALERALETLESHGHDILKTHSEAADSEPRDWHNDEHTWAKVANLIFDAKLLRPTLPPAVQYRVIDRMLAHDKKWSKLNDDQREPDAKDVIYWRDRLKTIQSTRR